MTEEYNFKAMQGTFLTPIGSTRYQKIRTVTDRMLTLSGAFLGEWVANEMRGDPHFTRAVLEQLSGVGVLLKIPNPSSPASFLASVFIRG